MTRLLTTLVAATATLLAIPCAANAFVQVGYTAANGVQVTGDAAATIVQMSVDPLDHYKINVIGADFVLNTGGCTSESASSFDCEITGSRAISATMGAGNDGFNLLGSSAQTPFGAATVDLGDGDDGVRAEGSSGGVTAVGGAGDDEFRGTGGNDTLNGGPGDDEFFGQAGADTMLGGDGNDIFFASARVGSSRVDLQACKLEYSIVSPK